MAESAVGLAGIFGPAGLFVSAVAGAGIALWNWHDRARDEAKKTEEAYRKLATTFSLPALMEGVRTFDASKQGKQLAEWTSKLEDLRSELAQFGRAGPATAGGFAAGKVGGARDIQAEIDALMTRMKPLVKQREDLVNLVEYQAIAEKGLLDATDKVARRTEATRDALRASAKWSADVLNNLEKLSAPTKLPSVWEDLKNGGPLKGVDVAATVAKNQAAAIERMKQSAEEWADTWGRAIRSTEYAFGHFFSAVLSGQVTKFRDFAASILRIWLDMITQMLAAQAGAKILGWLAPFAAGAAGGATGGGGGGGGGGIPGGGPPGIPGGGLAGVGPLASVGASSSYPVNVSFNIMAMDGASVERVVRGNPGVFARVIVDPINTSRQAEHAIRGRR